MRVSIVCGAGIVSGKEIMTLELADGLPPKGFEVQFVTSLWSDGAFKERLQVLGFVAHLMRLGFISATLTFDCLRMTAEQFLHWPGLLARYGSFLRREKPEYVIHTNWHHLLLLLPFLRPERDVFWLHEVIPNTPRYRRVFGWLDRRLQCFVAVSHAVGRSLRDIGITDTKIHVIHNGLRDPAISFVPDEAKSDRLRIGIIGQIGNWKGHGDLLEAFAAVAKSHPTVELHIFGRGSDSYENQLKQQAASLGIADKIIWRGYVLDRVEIYSRLSICVVPSRSNDPLPTTAIEAAFFCIPVIASRRGGLPEIVEDGVSGLLFEAGHPTELASRLSTLLENESLRREMGARARLRALEKFDRERFLKSFAHLLREH